MLGRLAGARGQSSNAIHLAGEEKQSTRNSLNLQTIMCRHSCLAVYGRRSTMSPVQRKSLNLQTIMFRHCCLAVHGRRSIMSSLQRDGEGRNESLAMDVFFCHSGKQKTLVRELYKDLTSKGVSCFFDEDHQSLPIAEKFPPRIFEATENCRIAVLILSKDFFHSKWPMLELSAFLKAKTSGKNPGMKLLPVFFMITPKSLSEITKDNQVWKDLGISDEIRAEWHSALREIRSIKGLEFKEAEDVVGFRDEVVKAICSLLLPHTPNSIQGQSLQDQVLDGLDGIPTTLLQPHHQQLLWTLFQSNIVLSMDQLRLQCRTSHQHTVMLYH